MGIKLAEVQERVERFFIRKAIILITLFLAGCWVIYSASQNIIESNKEVIKTTYEMKQSFIAIDTLGRLANLPRDFITPENSQERIADVLKLLIVDRNDITNRFKVDKFKQSTNILDNSASLKEFYFNYVQVLNGVNEDTEEYKKKGVSSLTAYLENIFQLYTGVKDENLKVVKELPYYMQISKEPTDTKIKKWKILEKNHFEIEVEYQTTIFKHDGRDADGKVLWKPYSSSTKIFANGYMDIQTQNLDKSKEELKGKNFDGLHFYSFNVVLGV